MNNLINKLEEIKDLSNSILRRKPKSVEPKELQQLVKELESKGVSGSALSPSIDLEMLNKKILRIYHGSNELLDWNESRNLPFLLAENSKDLSVTKFLLDKIDFHKISGFRRSLFAYFMNYDKNGKSTNLLRKKLILAIQEDEQKLWRVKFLKNNRNLLAINGTTELAKCFRDGIVIYLKKIGFPEGLFQSRFVINSIKSYFNSKLINIDDKMRGFEEVLTSPDYLFLIRLLAEPLILDVNEVNGEQYRDYLIQILHKEMGDPRISKNRINWGHISEKALNIYLSWLKRNDLDLFFEIISSTAIDSMWEYRKKFWENYLDDIGLTKVILGHEAEREAKNVAHSKMLNYDRLNKAYDKKQSIFVFSIKNYVFMEVSHNGSLRIWELSNSPFSFTYNDEPQTYSYSDIIHTYAEVKSFVHAAPEYGTWQYNVGSWIENYCGVNRY